MNMSATQSGTAAPGRRGEMLLEIEDLHVAYGKAEVVHGVSISVHAGEFVVLLGRNGAGKSTILHAVSGLIPKLSGRVRFDRADITHADPRAIVRSGVINVLEGHRVFTALSVEDNLLIGTYANTPRGDRSKLEGIYALFPELADHRQQLASRLSGGQQQILAVAQGVIADPRLLVLDEPSGGLAPIVIERVLEVASRLCAGGVAILLVEQLVEKALRHAHWSYLIETGRVAAAASSIDIQRSEMLHKAYLGGAIAAKA
jgi:branched-chain amino acid transport system ATP-binding protein